MANLDLRYRGKQIINRDVPLDDLTVHLIIHNGHITANPLNFAVGTGTIASNFDLNPVDGALHIKASIDVRKLPLSRLMGPAHTFAGDGTVGGSAYITGTGNSVAAILGGGDGHASLFLQNGADVRALMTGLAGSRTGDALLSALNIPAKAKIQCMISDFSLTGGLVDTKTFLKTNGEANILSAGKVDLSTETLNLALWRDAAHASTGSLSTPITIDGTLKNPSMSLTPGPLAARAGPATALGVLFPPRAILPTIRLGLGDKNACVDAISALDAGPPRGSTGR